MITLKNAHEISDMKKACYISAVALKVGADAVAEGASTYDIDRIIFETIKKHGATPSFLNYNGYPASACISLNDEVIHGIPSKKRKIKTGDIVSIDVGAYFNGFHGDNATTVACGEISEGAKTLLDTTVKSLNLAITFAKGGNRIGDISSSIQNFVTQRGFFPVKEFVGHGIGRKLHEEPEVPNFGKAGHGPRLVPGMTIAIEPMINQLSSDVVVLDDDWTTVTKLGGLSAHFEHTILITDKDAIILTDLNEG